MALRFNNKYTFYHIPKTAGTYIREIIKQLPCPSQEIGTSENILLTHNCPLDVKDHSYENSFCVIRHPVQLYKSLYRYKIQTKDFSFWANGCRAYDNFNEFVSQILEVRPAGYATEWYTRFVPFCKYVLKQENLNQELSDLLEYWGFDNFPIVKRKNLSRKNINTDLNDKIYHKLLATEQGIISYLKY